MALAIILMMPCATPYMSSFAASKGVSLTNYTKPQKIVEGNYFILKGKISSQKNNVYIRRVELGVVNYNTEKWTTQKFDKKNMNVKSFNIADADSKIRFGKLKAGKYLYRIYAHTSDGKVHVVLNTSFVVEKKKTQKTSTTKKSTSSSKKKTATNVSIKIKGGNTPGNYKVGKKFNPKGIITSTRTINRVEIGIVVNATNKWTEYKYDKKISSKTFDISNAAWKLKFNDLPGGDYRYRIYAHTDKGATIVLDKKFTVTPSNKPMKAVNWAKRIANDNSFNYGKRPETNNVGCYFCGTNHRTKPKGYEKTYVCLTFLGAAYAHGANDPEILKKCQRGKMTMYSNNDNFNKFSCWMKIGRCKDLKITDLQPGDVIVDWSSDNGDGHVWMYIGGDSYVDAAIGGWSKQSIAIRGNASNYLKWCGKDNSLNYVMRYRR